MVESDEVKLQKPFEFVVGATMFVVPEINVPEIGAKAPTVGVPLETVNRATREVALKAPLAAWVKVIWVLPAFKSLTVRPVAVPIVVSARVTDQAPGEFEVGGVRVVEPRSRLTLTGDGFETIGNAAKAGVTWSVRVPTNNGNNKECRTLRFMSELSLVSMRGSGI
jgi:hypothetical protein